MLSKSFNLNAGVVRWLTHSEEISVMNKSNLII